MKLRPITLALLGVSIGKGIGDVGKRISGLDIAVKNTCGFQKMGVNGSALRRT